METELKVIISIHSSVLSFLHETRFFFSLSFITVLFLSLHVGEHKYVYVHVHAPMHIFKMLTVVFTIHCTVAPLTYTPSQKGRGRVNAKLAPAHASEKCQSIYKNGLLKQYQQLFFMLILYWPRQTARDRHSFLFLGS